MMKMMLIMMTTNDTAHRFISISLAIRQERMNLFSQLRQSYHIQLDNIYHEARIKYSICPRNQTKQKLEQLRTNKMKCNLFR